MATKKKKAAPDVEHGEVGHFATVTHGPHKGAYGVLIDYVGDEKAVLRTRDHAEQRFVVALADTVRDTPGRR